MESGLTEEYDLEFESIRKTYEEKGRSVDRSLATILGKIRRRFESGSFQIPLSPLYLETTLKYYLDFKGDGEPYDNLDVDFSSYNVLGYNSINSYICRDVVLGLYFNDIAKKVFCRDNPKITYTEVFEKLSWSHLEYLFVLVFSNVDLFTGYQDALELQKSWEFSAMGALFSTRLSEVLGLDAETSEKLFLSLLLKDIGRFLIYWEFPRVEGEENKRSLKSDPDIQIDEDLFQSILYHLHPLLSYQISQKYGFSNEISEDILYHHVHADDLRKVSITVKYHKLINKMIDFGVCNLDSKKMLEFCDDIRLDIKDFLLDEFLAKVQSIDIGNLDRSLIDPESGTMGRTTGYEVLDDEKGGYFVNTDNIYFHVNMLQEVKDTIKKVLVASCLLI